MQKYRKLKSWEQMGYINLDGKRCLRIRPHGIFRVKQLPYIKNNDKICFFNCHNLGFYKLFGKMLQVFAKHFSVIEHM